MKVEKKNGFTLIELLVVIAVIALLMAIIMPALGKAKMYAQRIICANHVRQQGLGTMLYANENDTYVPCPQAYSISTPEGPSSTVSLNGGWFWDISFWFTNQLSEYAGFDKSDFSVFTCPANKMRKPDDALWIQYSMAPGGPSPQPLQDEETLTMDQQRWNFRVAPYLYLYDRYVFKKDPRSLYDPKCSISVPFSRTTAYGRPMEKMVVRKLSNVQSAGSKPLILDAVISTSALQFSGLSVGGIDNLSNFTLTDDTNHLSRQPIGSGATASQKPEGLNITYADGHAEWKSAGNFNPSTAIFENIQVQYDYGQRFWW